MTGGLLAMLCVAPAAAQNRSFCADRPSRGTPACTLAAGEAIIEVTAVSFDISYDPIARNETLTVGDTLLRFGIDEATEVQLGIAALVDATTRDRVTGAIDSSSAIGDSYLAVRRGVSEGVAVEVFVTLPTGKGASGAGDWGTGLLLPIDVAAPDGFTFSLTPEIHAAVNASGVGRHLTVGAVAGFSHALSDGVAAGFEFAAFHDDDPDGAAFIGDVTGSLAWQAAERLQANAEVNFGVAHGEPRASAFFGFAITL